MVGRVLGRLWRVFHYSENANHPTFPSEELPLARRLVLALQ